MKPTVLRRLSSVLLPVALTLAGCATVPEPSPVEVSPISEALSPELHEFVVTLQTESTGFDPLLKPDLIALLDLERMDDLRDELVRRGVLDNRIARRAERVLVTVVPGEPVRLWVKGRFSRFWSAIALSSRGWRRRIPGVWQDPDGTTVTLLRGGVIRVDLPHREDSRPGLDEVSGPRSFSSIAQLNRLSDDPIAAIVLVKPDMGAVLHGFDPGSLQPMDLVVQVRDDRGLEVALRFSGDREARVVLVTLRLTSRAMIEALKLTPGPEFALTREGDEVYLRGVELTPESLERLLDRLGWGEPREDEQ